MKKINQNFRCFIIILFILISTITHAQTQWSDPATWGGIMPAAGDDVIITASMYVILDEDTPALGSLTINGVLDFGNQDLNLTSDWILITGQLNVGSEAIPYSHNAVFTLTGTDPNEVVIDGIMASRGIVIRGGALELHGNPPSVPWTKINAHAVQGSTSLTLMQNVNWHIDDQIVIAPTDYYEAGFSQNSISQRVTLTSIGGVNLSFDQGLNAHRWGLLQYATNSGMSLSSSNRVTPPATAGFTPTILDERASVGNLTRNIVIQAPDDAAWNNNGFGVHVIVMRNAVGDIGIGHIDGVEFRRGGQRGRLGRYPFHWHMISYSGSNELGDAIGQYIRNSSINDSQNRGIVIHGTNGAEVSNNVIYDVRGHAVFLEDGSERRNLIDGNLVLHVRNPDNPSDALKVHESTSNTSSGSSGFWISNPDNEIINNTAADCTKNGFWFAFGTQPVGLSQLININPQRTRFGVFDNNTAHSNAFEGIRRENGESDESGNLGVRGRYISTSTGENTQGQEHIRERFELKSYKVWKNGFRGIWDRSDWSDNLEVVSADNQGVYFTGAGFDGFIERSLVIGTSLNHLMNGTGRATNGGGFAIPAAFATYHSTFTLKDNIVVNFPAVEGRNSGVFATDDYYLRPVEKGQVLNTNNLIVNSNMGVKMIARDPWFVLAGALWDPNGDWSATPEKYLVYDTPFFTYGQTPENVDQSGVSTGGVAVDGPFYGFNDFAINKPADIYLDYMEIAVDRLNTSFTSVGTWHVPESVIGAPLGHMRHFAAHPTSVYRLTFPSLAEEVTDIALAVTNMHTTDDVQVVAIPFSGNYIIGQVFTTSIFFNHMDDDLAMSPSTNEKHNYIAVANRQAVADSEGETFWHDTANDLVWIKVQGGMAGDWDFNGVISNRDERLYREFFLRIFGEENLLPISLEHFEAHINSENKVELTWSTASEFNNDYFLIERSTEGRSWKEVVKINSAGDSNIIQYYSTIDEASANGTSYYRLKQTDRDGNFAYSEIVIIQLNIDQFAEIQPNPTSNYFKILLNENFSEVEMKIINSKGQKIVEQTIHQAVDFNVDTSTLAAGIYYVHIKKKNDINILKLIKL